MSVGPQLDRPSPGRTPREWLRLHRELQSRLRAAGCLERAPRHYAVRGVLVAGAVGGAWVVLLLAGSWWPLAAAVAALATVQSGMLGHDIGHGQVSTDRRRTEQLGQVFVSAATGMGFTYWRTRHDRHHAAANEIGSDPDLDTPFFSFTAEQAASRRGFPRWLTARQGWLIWPLVSIQAFFIKVRSLALAARDPAARWDRLGLAVHYGLWLGLPALLIGPVAAALHFALLTWFVGPYLTAAFVWNHVGTEFPTERMPFLEQQLRCSRNLPGGAVRSVLLGWLNFHAEHHVAPGAPSPRLPELRRVLRAFCEEHDLPWVEEGWLQGMAGVQRHLAEVGKAATPMAESAGTAEAPAVP